MKICLKTQAKDAKPRHVTVKLHQRLPHHVHCVSELSCDYHVESLDHYYLLTLHVSGEVEVYCQRCMRIFKYPYAHKTELAICANDVDAESLMPLYECMVDNRSEVDLEEIVTDDLHLFLPEKHINPEECDKTATNW